MNYLGRWMRRGSTVRVLTTFTAAAALVGAASAGACGGDETNDGTGGGQNGGAGGSAASCTTTALGATRGSAIALSADDSRIVAVNRDVGTVTILAVDYADGKPAMTVVDELTIGAEPWQVVLDGCGDRAYVISRKDQKVVEITGVSGTPAVGRSAPVGSEPTGLALTPNNSKLYVSNWVDGTLTVIDPATMQVTGTVDLNPTIVATGSLGSVTPRPALAHPRAIAITNNGDASDADEDVYVTEWFALRTDPEDATGTNSDHNWKGLLYKVGVASGTATSIDLPPIIDTGFLDAKGFSTGCFPNQVGSVTIDGGFAYVTSTCASPVGPTGVFQRGACAVNGQCASFGAGSVCSGGVCTASCTSDAQCGGPLAQPGDCNAGQCKPAVDNAKTTTHPAVSIVNLSAGTATTENLDIRYQSAATTNGFALRVPLLPTDMDFRPGFGYIAGEGADALFRVTVGSGAIAAVGSATNNFIDLRKDAADKLIRLPIGVAVSKNQAFAFVANDGSRDVTAVDLNSQSIAGDAAGADFRIAQASALPASGTHDDVVLKGKRFFNTGLGRWSLRGQAWGSCGACHIDGLTDNITWYFGRGPRQTVSLDGSFDSENPDDQRVFNWTGIFDEVADFEGNTRGISGGVGAIVSTVSSPPAVTDRINTGAGPVPQQALQGSSINIADPTNPLGDTLTHSVISDWLEVTEWVKTIRSPRRPTTLDAADVAAGKALFADQAQANCGGCHSGGKWTMSTLFYTPGSIPNAAFGDAAVTSLSNVTYDVALNGFPAALVPAPSGSRFMRSGLPIAFEQIQCVLRPVGTILPAPAAGQIPIGVSDPEVNVIELRNDMVTGGQGSGSQGANDFTTGFNPPSLLGMQVGAPYFHAGNARTLEELLSSLFTGHHQSAVAQVFAPSATQVRQLVAYMLAIDEDEPIVTGPAKGAKGGDLCFYP